MKLNLNNSKILNLITNKTPAGEEVSPELVKMQKNILLKAALALLTVVLTIVILFAMTSAWYTNIVQTSGLVFQVESWGFTGDITVAEAEEGFSIKAAPGDEDALTITANNESNETTPLTVNVSKKEMYEKEMEKRLFFYVDTPMVKNGETMERVYINSKEGYTYTLFGESTLMLGKEVANAPKLKWQWVYDVLGYYVLATPQEISDGDGVTVTDTATGTSDNEKIEMVIEEYLRPIEYDFDKATFEIEGTGENSRLVLKTVDGTTTPEEFLKELFAKDGYANEEIAVIGNDVEDCTGKYYPVDIDEETGRGVYAYLCSYTEIEEATKFDTDLGNNANGESVPAYKVELNFSAEAATETPEEVENAAELKNAFAEGGYIKLSSNIELTEAISLPEGKELTVDFNGKTIVAAKTITAKEGSSLTMLNGTIQSKAEKSGEGITSAGAEVTLDRMEITGFNRGINIVDNTAAKKTDSTVRVVNSTIEGETCSIFISGNGTDSEQKTRLIVENCTLNSHGYGIVGNGSDNRVGTDITVINSKITVIGTKYADGSGEWGAGIYHPQKNSNLTIYNSHIEGLSGITIKGGNVTVIGEKTGTKEDATTIKGTGDAATPDALQSGAADTGDGIYIENTYGNEISLTIKGDTRVESNYDYALRVYNENANDVSITIKQGTFVSGKEYGTEGYNFSENWIAGDSTLTKSTDGKTISVTSGTAEQ